MEALKPFIVENYQQVLINFWKLRSLFLKTNCRFNIFKDPEPFPYLKHDDPYSFDINLEVAIKGEDDIPNLICSNNNDY